MTCLDCHAPEVTVTDVDRDGKVTVTCRACRTTFILHAHPSRVTDVRALGASLAAHQRHLASTPRQLAVSRLVAKGAVRKNQPVKVLGNGDISVAVQISVDAASATAKSKIEAAGGSVTTA